MKNPALQEYTHIGIHFGQLYPIKSGAYPLQAEHEIRKAPTHRPSATAFFYYKQNSHQQHIKMIVLFLSFTPLSLALKSQRHHTVPRAPAEPA